MTTAHKNPKTATSEGDYRENESMRKRALVAQRIRWENPPPLEAMPPVVGRKHGFAVSEKAGVSFAGGPPPQIPLDHVLKHGTRIIAKVRDQYREAGFSTKVVLQDPLSHKGPTTACTIGFPSGLPKNLWTEKLRLFKRFVCRIHVDIVTLPSQELASIPHVEPDPVFHPKEHLEYSTLKHLELVGPAAVRILRHFFDL
jgi:hypothetical protein